MKTATTKELHLVLTWFLLPRQHTNQNQLGEETVYLVFTFSL